jgi:acylglycerol lipase
MRRTKGGGLSLGFPTRSNPPPEPSTVSLLRGIISTSPLIQQTTPVSKFSRCAGSIVASIAPDLVISAPVNANVSLLPQFLSRKSSLEYP